MPRRDLACRLVAQYAVLMIKDARSYARLCESERWQALRDMSVEESIAVGEALLTSEIMDLAAFDDKARPISLALSLGIPRPSL
jgi:hypothetical protein